MKSEEEKIQGADRSFRVDTRGAIVIGWSVTNVLHGVQHPNLFRVDNKEVHFWNHQETDKK